MKIISSRWSKDDVGFYILPFVAFSYGEYGNQLWIGWYKYLWTIILHSDVQGSKAYLTTIAEEARMEERERIRKSFDHWFKKGTEDVEDWAERVLTTTNNK